MEKKITQVVPRRHWFSGIAICGALNVLSAALLSCLFCLSCNVEKKKEAHDTAAKEVKRANSDVADRVRRKISSTLEQRTAGESTRTPRLATGNETDIERLKNAMESLGKCGVAVDGVVRECEQISKYRQEILKLNPDDATKINLGREYAASENAAVRLEAFRLLYKSINKEGVLLEQLISLARKENDENVLNGTIRMLGAKLKEHQAVLNLLVDMSRHQSRIVRKSAIGSLLESYAIGNHDAFTAAVQRLEKDDSMDVRAYTCARLYGNEDADAITFFKKYLLDKETPVELYRACWKGLVKSWAGNTPPSNPSRDGYALTLKLLQDGNRDDIRPDWTGISLMRSAGVTEKAEEQKNDEWRANLKKFFNIAEIKTVLWDIFRDEKASIATRTTCLRVLGAMGEPRTSFMKLEKKYIEAESPNELKIKHQLASILANWNDVHYVK